MACDHYFTRNNPGVEQLLQAVKDHPFSSNLPYPKIFDQASRKLANCPECALYFHKKMLSLLRKFIKPESAVAVWAMYMVGYQPKEIAEALDIDKATVSRGKKAVMRKFLAEVDMAFELPVLVEEVDE